MLAEAQYLIDKDNEEQVKALQRLEKAWGVGIVFLNNLGYHGVYYDIELLRETSVFLGTDLKQAMKRINYDYLFMMSKILIILRVTGISCPPRCKSIL